MAFDAANAYHSQYTNATGLATGAKTRKSENQNWLTSANYFDNKGRVIQSFSTNLYGQVERNDRQYNFAGEVLKSREAKKNQAGTLTTKTKTYQYDHTGRKTSYQLDLGNINGETIVNYEYDETGRMKRKVFLPNGTFTIDGVKDYIIRPSPNGTVSQSNAQDVAKKAVILEPTTDIQAVTLNSYLATIDPNALGGIPISGLQTIDYHWHIRGGLRGINLDGNGNPSPNSTHGDLFAYKLDYETAGFYDGNIGKQTWHDGTAQRNYQFSYDYAKRLKSATYTGINSEDYSLPNIDYNRNGNITNLQRKGKNSGIFGDIDNLTYYYSGNRLTGVSDAISGNENVGDFRDNGSSSDYTYWNDGSLKSDANKGISLIEYDSFLQRVSQVTFSNGNWVKFFYDGEGTLLKRQLSNGEVWEYADGFLYKNSSAGQPQLYQINDDEGRITYNNGVYSYEFEYRDIWGNLRVGFKANGTQLETIQHNDFDITGFELRPLGFENALTRQNYKFQNQERVSDFDLDIDFFKFRPSDSKIVRFWQIDPLSSDYPYNSPYAFQENKFGSGVELEGLELGPFPLPALPYVIPAIEAGIEILAATGVGATLVELARNSSGGVSAYNPALGLAMSTSRPGELTTMLNSSSNRVQRNSNSNVSANQPSSGVGAPAPNGDDRNQRNDEKELIIDGKKHPEAAKHAQDAIDSGVPNTGVVDRAGKNARRRDNMKGIGTEPKKDRDEFPPAVIRAFS